MHKNKTKEPLFHIAKRAALPWYLSWAIRIGAIVLALVACAALTVFLTHEKSVPGVCHHVPWCL